MPVVNTSMALLPVAEASNAEPTENQPRQPMSLQGLLRFSMEATRAEDAPSNSEFAPMDEERKKFLEEALNSMSVDVVQIMQRQIAFLKGVESVDPSECNTNYLEAIETILEYVDNIDIANDFHKIGGFTTIYPCMKSKDSKIRAAGCELLAVLCQNNPYCQTVVLDNEFIPKLLHMIENDNDGQVVTKAIYALGGIVRDNPEGLTQLIHYNGLTMLLNCLKSNHENVIIKSAFLLGTLCRATPNLKEKLTSLGCVPQLISLFLTERSACHEHVMSLLVSVLEDNPVAVDQFKNHSPDMRDSLQRYLSGVNNREECLEEETYCKRLLHILQS
ncbi:hsp70-binding protein 1 [Diabrotica virgifera virgifera]|uniref:Hsp70-binding protein 1 n=1 Tax=Diabrotica virgifera virgifera TaxID=50390 RepID=A0A6P7HDM6_DIAVI|nr:hsp70-binding protein 1 [Diabrotica virgifera virgifera]